MPAAYLFAADQAALSASQVKGTSIGGWPLRYSRTSESDRVRPGGAQSSPPHAAQPELTARREALEDVLRRDQLTWLTAPGAAGGGYVASQRRAHRFAVDRPQGGKVDPVQAALVDMVEPAQNRSDGDPAVAA